MPNCCRETDDPKKKQPTRRVIARAQMIETNNLGGKLQIPDVVPARDAVDEQNPKSNTDDDNRRHAPA